MPYPHYDVKRLKELHDSVEAHIRGLHALGLSASDMLSSILVNKLPLELRLIISREMDGGRWGLVKVMDIVDLGVDARERASVLTTSNSLHH